jgi:hypothetical protein
VAGARRSWPRMNLKSVKPLLPPISEVVAEKHDRGRVGQRLREDGEIHALDARAEREEAEDEASRPGTRNTIVSANGKLANGSQNAGSLVQPRKTRKSGIGLAGLVLPEGADHAHEVHAVHVAAEGEEERLAQTEQAGVAPEQVHRDGEQRVAKIFAPSPMVKLLTKPKAWSVGKTTISSTATAATTIHSKRSRAAGAGEGISALMAVRRIPRRGANGRGAVLLRPKALDNGRAQQDCAPTK